MSGREFTPNDSIQANYCTSSSWNVCPMHCIARDLEHEIQHDRSSYRPAVKNAARTYFRFT